MVFCLDAIGNLTRHWSKGMDVMDIVCVDVITYPYNELNAASTLCR